MDPIAAASVSQSIQAVNNVLKTATQETTEAATKMVKAAVEIKVGDPTSQGGTPTVDGYI
jgi:hypothetical protein